MGYRIAKIYTRTGETRPKNQTTRFAPSVAPMATT
jgi:hypothetical protein